MSAPPSSNPDTSSLSWLSNRTTGGCAAPAGSGVGAATAPAAATTAAVPSRSVDVSFLRPRAGPGPHPDRRACRVRSRGCYRCRRRVRHRPRHPAATAASATAAEALSPIAEHRQVGATLYMIGLASSIVVVRSRDPPSDVAQGAPT